MSCHRGVRGSRLRCLHCEEGSHSPDAPGDSLKKQASHTQMWSSETWRGFTASSAHMNANRALCIRRMKDKMRNGKDCTFSPPQSRNTDDLLDSPASEFPANNARYCLLLFTLRRNFESIVIKCFIAISTLIVTSLALFELRLAAVIHSKNRTAIMTVQVPIQASVSVLERRMYHNIQQPRYGKTTHKDLVTNSYKRNAAPCDSSVGSCHRPLSFRYR